MSTKLPHKTYSDCQGCSLCLLPCPMWQQHRDVMFSPQGMAKAMQSGAQAEDLQAYAACCIQCGACDVLCPESIDLSTWIRDLAQGTSHQEEAELSGFVMSCDANVQAQITHDDLYIIDAAPFHADYARRVEHYTSLRIQTGCSMNLDLNRMAIPTGIGSDAANAGLFDVEKQMQWLMQGRDFERVIVENPNDVKILAEITKKAVVCVSDLMEEAVYAAS